MSDVAITINGTTHKYDLMKDTQSGAKLINISEESLVPAKTIVGSPSYGDINPEKLLALSQNNWRGGVGRYRFDTADKFLDGASIDGRVENKLRLGPYLNTSISAVSSAIQFIEFNGSLYVCNATIISKSATGGATWSTVKTITGDTIVSLSIYDGCLFANLTTGKQWYSADGTTWAQSALDNSELKYGIQAPPASGTKDVFAGVKLPNLLYTSIDPISGSWSAIPNYVGSASTAINGLYILAGDLIVGKEDGLYLIDTSGINMCLLNVVPHQALGLNVYNFKRGCYYQGCLCLCVNGKILMLSPYYSMDFIDPMSCNPQLEKNAAVIDVTSDDKYLYALVQTAVSGVRIIYCGQLRTDHAYGKRWEWHPLIDLNATPCNTIKIMQSTYDNIPKLFFGNNAYIGYCVIDPLDANYLYAPSGYLITSNFDNEYSTWDKLFYQLNVLSETGGIPTGGNIKVYYEANMSGSFTLIATVTAAGVSLTNLTPIVAKRIRLKIELNASSGHLSPTLLGIILRGILQTEVMHVVDFTLALDQDQARKVSSELTFLRTGRNAASAITFADLRFNTSRQVIFLPGSPTEVELIDEITKQPTYGIRIKAQELNWTLPT
jgi:hypothetical protein